MSNYLGFVPYTGEEDYYFISYSSEDSNRVGEIISDLEKKLSKSGRHLWYDEGIKHTNDTWAETIEEKLLGSRGVIVFGSKSVFSRKDSYVINELNLAQDENINIIRLIIDGQDIIKQNLAPGFRLDVWPRYMRHQVIDLSQKSAAEAVENILKELDKLEDIYIHDKEKLLVENISENDIQTVISYLNWVDSHEILSVSEEIKDDIYMNVLRSDNSEALSLLAEMVKDGSKIPYDLTWIIELYSHAMDICEQKGAFEEYFEWCTKGASEGDAVSMSKLGDCYLNGDGVSQDFEAAFAWYCKAAELGNAAAMNGLGACFHNGEGTNQDYEEAIRWYKNAAELGNAAAMNNLGICYHKGEGTEQNYAEAFIWYNNAAESGNAYAMKNLGDYFFYGIGREKDYLSAYNWYDQADRLGIECPELLEAYGYVMK